MKFRQSFAPGIKVVILFVVISALAQHSNAQSMATAENIDYRKSAYLGFGTGLNSYTGLFGLRLEVPMTDRFHIFGSAGLGSWGYKIGGGISYNLRKSLYGPALSIGYTSATGLADFETSLETTADKMETVTLDLKPVGNILIMYTYQWKVGKANKISLGAGYAASHNTDNYEVTSNHTLTSTSRQVMQMMAPGGLVVSITFVFGM